MFITLLPYVKSLRLLHWLKNVLILAPALITHSLQIKDIGSFMFYILIFCLTASSVYCLNDLVDLEKDKKNPEKSKRPYASGSISKLQILFLGLSLGLVSVALAYIFMPIESFLLIICYLVLNLLYSYLVKNLFLVDCFLLAVFYLIRILIGENLINVMYDKEVSVFFITFSISIFCGLAFIKRLNSLQRNIENNINQEYIYSEPHIMTLKSFSLFFGISSIIIFFIYSMVPAQENYLHPEFLLIALIFLSIFYWRLYFFASKGSMNYDPIVFSFSNTEPIVLMIITSFIFYYSY